jgi:hypothetical protein
VWSYTSTLIYLFMAWCLVKHRDTFSLTLPVMTDCCLFSVLALYRYKIKDHCVGIFLMLSTCIVYLNTFFLSKCVTTTSSRKVLGPTQPPIQRLPGILSLGLKRPGREADHSPPSSAEVKNAWSYTSTRPIRLHGVVL